MLLTMQYVSSASRGPFSDKWTVLLWHFSSLSTSQSTFTRQVSIHPFTHTFTHTDLSTKSQPAHQELIRTYSHIHCKGIRGSFGFHSLAQGHINMWTGGARDRATNRLIGGRLALPPEPRPPQKLSQTSATIDKIQILIMGDGVFIVENE